MGQNSSLRNKIFLTFSNPSFFLFLLPFSYLVVIISWSTLYYFANIFPLLKYRSTVATVFPLSHTEIVWISNRNGLCAISSEGNYSGRGTAITCKLNGPKKIIILNDGIYMWTGFIIVYFQFKFLVFISIYQSDCMLSCNASYKGGGGDYISQCLTNRTCKFQMDCHDVTNVSKFFFNVPVTSFFKETFSWSLPITYLQRAFNVLNVF